MSRAAASRWLRFGRRVTSSTGVETEIMTASSSRGSSDPLKIDVPTDSG
jgi:hypothetical protein